MELRKILGLRCLVIQLSEMGTWQYGKQFCTITGLHGLTDKVLTLNIGSLTTVCPSLSEAHLKKASSACGSLDGVSPKVWLLTISA